MPQVVLQALLYFGVIKGLSLTTITDRDLALSIGSAIFNSLIQLFRLKKESTAAQESFVQYSLSCITARFGWVPFNHKLEQFVDNEQKVLSLNYKIQYPLPLVTSLSKYILDRNDIEPLQITTKSHLNRATT